MKKLSIIPPVVISSIMLLIAISDCQYGYYVLLRLVVSAVGLLLIWHSYNFKRMIWFWAFCLLVLVFNPLVPVRFDKETWRFLDAATAAAMLLYLWVARKDKS
jgi:hypothetical protein